MTRVWAVIPVKHTGRSKQRLADVLTPDERERLTLAMLHDILNILRGTDRMNGILVATRSPQIRDVATGLGAEVFAESAGASHSMAVSQACAHLCSHHNASTAIILPGDIPRVTSQDIDGLIAGHIAGDDCITLVPDVRGEGTNAILASPPDAIKFSFGAQSLQRHFDSALNDGIVPRIVMNEKLSLDIDYPDDLIRAVVELRPSRSVTGRFLEESGIAARLGVCNDARSPTPNPNPISDTASPCA